MEIIINKLDLVSTCFADGKRNLCFDLCRSCREKVQHKFPITNGKYQTNDKGLTPAGAEGQSAQQPPRQKADTHMKERQNATRTHRNQTVLKDSIKPSQHKIEIDHLNTEVECLKISIESKEYSFHSLQEKSEKDIEGHKTEIETLKQQIKQITDKLASAASDRERLSTALECSGTEKQNAETEMKMLTEQWKVTKLGLTEQVKSMTKQHENEKSDMDSTIGSLHQCVDELKKDLVVNNDELHKVKAELEEKRRPKKKVTVMGIRGDRSGMGKTMVDVFTKALTSRLQDRLDRENVTLTTKSCHTAADIPNGPLVVLCLNMSRVGTNIQEILTGITAARDVFVIVLHQTSEDNLSSLTPTSLRVSGSEFRRLGGILDMAFTSDKMLYDCDINNSSVEKLAMILMKYICTY